MSQKREGNKKKFQALYTRKLWISHEVKNKTHFKTFFSCKMSLTLRDKQKSNIKKHPSLSIINI